MRPQKNLTLKKYMFGLGNSILTSQFIYSSLENISRLKRVKLTIKTRKQKKIPYMYLWLLTKTVPLWHKFYSSWKNNSRNVFMKKIEKRFNLYATLRSKHIFSILHEILMDIISKQKMAEKKTWVFHHHQMQVTIFSAGVTKNSSSLQTKNTYFPNMPLTLNFKFSKTTAFQKLFLIRMLKIVSPDFKLAGLDSFED